VPRLQTSLQGFLAFIPPDSAVTVAAERVSELLEEEPPDVEELLE
jgi:hypothetical protein